MTETHGTINNSTRQTAINGQNQADFVTDVSEEKRECRSKTKEKKKSLLSSALTRVETKA